MSQIAQDAVESETSGTGQDDTNNTGTTDGQQQQQADTTTTGQTQTGDDVPDERTRKLIDDVRGDFKKEREKRQAAEAKAKTAGEEARADLAKQFGKILGLVEDDAPPNPDDLLQQLSGKDSELRQSRVELALYRTAGPAGADAEALLDSRRFMAQVDKLDPASDTFSADLASAIKAAVEADPKLATATGPVPERSGGEITGGSGERHTTNPNDFSIEEHRKERRKRRGLE